MKNSSHFSVLHFWFLPVSISVSVCLYLYLYLLEAPLNVEMPAEINYDYLPL